MISMKRPSRGARESATTTRYRGRLFEPSRLSRMATATFSPPRHRKAAQALQLAQAALHRFELLHHLLQLCELLEQPVHVLHAGTAAARDALAARAVDHFWVAALTRRHRADDGVEPVEVRLLARQLLGRALEHLAEGQHAQDLVERAERTHLLELRAEVLQREGLLAQLLDHRLGLGLVDVLLRLLDQREDVAHAEDPRGEAIGMERLEGVGLLAHADEGDRPARDVADAERGAAARVAVHLGKDHGVDAHGLVEAVGHRHRVLARHRVDDEQHVVRLDRRADLLELVEHRLVDVQASGRVEDQRREPSLGGRLEGGAADLDRRPAGVADDGDVHLGAERLELVLGGGAIDVGGGEDRVLPLLGVEARELRRGRRLAGALQADQHDDGGRVGCGRESMTAAAQQLDQLLVHDLDDLLRRSQGSENVLADRLHFHAVDEAADDLEVDVGLQERHPYFPESFLDVVFAQAALAAQTIEDGCESCAQRVEHGKPSVRNYAENFNSGGVLRGFSYERRSAWTRTRTASQRSGTSSRGPNGMTRMARASQKSTDFQHAFQSHGSRPSGFSQRPTFGPPDAGTVRAGCQIHGKRIQGLGRAWPARLGGLLAGLVNDY